MNDVGASPYCNFDAVMNVIGGSLVSIVVYFLLLWVVPAFGAALGERGKCQDISLLPLFLAL
ncbi:MAG: hypothetical protein ACE5GO_03015 [Anaerolineales bacterium]